MESKQFVDWLNQELNRRGWSQRELARRADVSHSSVARVLDRSRRPTFDFCASVAEALGEPPIRLFQIAGLMPPLPPLDDKDVRELAELMRPLTPSQRRDVIEYARWRFQQNQSS